MQPYEQNQTAYGTGFARTAAQVDQGLRAFMLGVYNNMVLGLAISALVALGINMLATTSDPSQAVARIGGVNLTQFGATLYGSPLMWVVALAPLAFIFFFSFRMDRMSAAAARGTFFAFAAVMGASLSTLLIRYTGASVVQVFFITAAAFGSLSLWGYTTNRSLSGMGSFLIMGLARPDPGLDRQHLRGIEHAAVRHFRDRRADLRRPDGLRHAEAEGDVPLRQFRLRDRREGLRVRRPDAVSGLHQHVPVPPRARGQPQRVRTNGASDREAPAERSGCYRQMQFRKV